MGEDALPISPEPGPGLADALWAFALAVYAGPGASEACLALQDRARANIPLLLFVLWLGAERGVLLSAQEMERASDLVGDWHGEVVGALRTVRRRLKAGPYPAPTAATEALRETVKAIELSAERIELDTLARLAADGRWTATTAPSAEAAEHNLQVMLRAMPAAATAGQPWAAEAMARLVAAVRGRT